MKLNQNSQIKIVIVGLGLLGGSYARALKKKGYTVLAIEKKPESIAYALENGIIDEGSTEIKAEYFDGASLAVFALYPHVLEEWIRNFSHLLPSGLVLTDVTGVKSGLVERIQSLLPQGVEYIAAHPMAGREVGGVENSDENIFLGANYIVVPTEKNSAEAIELSKELGKELGFSNISVLSPQKHDEMIAFLSQLTHCIAVSLMCASSDPDLVRYTGDSFRDLTRIARIQENLWSELFLCNKGYLLEEMDRFHESFLRLRESIEKEDVESMKEMMRLSTARRALFDRKGE